MENMEKAPPLLQAKLITKTFAYPSKIELLKGISLDLHSGESIAIMGSSGVGKSSLLHILGTLEESTSGTLIICGKEVAKTPLSYLRNQHIGFIFQAFNLLEDHTALQNILMPALIAKKDTRKGSKAYERSFELLEKVGMIDRAHFPAKLLSGGEKQRIAIARALLNDPEILLADEPSGSLDDSTSGKIHELLYQCVQDFNKALIVVTHDPDLAKLCHKTFHLQDGKLI